MHDNTTIRQELDQIAAMLEGLRGPLPVPYAQAVTGNDWLRDQIPTGAGATQQRSRWAPAMAAASLTAGLFTSPPGYALPTAGAVPGTGDLAGLIPAPPVVLAPGAALEQGSRFLTNLGQTQVAPPASQVTPPASLVAPPASQVAPSASQVAPPASQVAPPASKVAIQSEPVPSKVDLPFATEPAPGDPEGDARKSAESADLPAVDLPFRNQETKVTLPPAVEEVRRASKPAAPVSKVRKAPKKSRVAPAQARSQNTLRWHTIKPGETLIKLARQYYHGSGGRWKAIFAFNKARLQDANRVYPGQQIVIPTLAEAVAAERGQVPYVAAHAAAAHAGAPHSPAVRSARTSERTRPVGRWRHKTRIANRGPILKPKPGVPI